MWELIRANKRNSIMLMVLMAVVLLALGYVVGAVLFGPVSSFTRSHQGNYTGAQPQTSHGVYYGGFIGLIVAAVIWLILLMVSFSRGDQILLAASKAKPVTHDVHPQLFNVVEEMKIAASLPMPKVYIIPDASPNAFATGRNPKTASVAVTAELLGRLNRDELQGVIAHEMSHILHRDILFVTMAGIMLGSIVLLSQVFLRGMFYSSLGGGSRRYSSGGKGGGGGALIMLVVAIFAAILAPIMAHILYYALSRKREYLADAGAARLTRYPEGLASALEKIAGDKSPQLASANKVTAPMYIVNPFKKKGMKLSDLSSTHPPISERIKILRGMTHGASFKDYSRSFSDITKTKTVIPPTALTKEGIALREASAKGKEKARLEKQMHQIGDLMRTVNGFVFLTCLCGLKLKVPPNYKASKVACPRCKRKLDIPSSKK